MNQFKNLKELILPIEEIQKLIVGFQKNIHQTILLKTNN